MKDSPRHFSKFFVFDGKRAFLFGTPFTVIYWSLKVLIISDFSVKLSTFHKIKSVIVTVGTNSKN